MAMFEVRNLKKYFPVKKGFLKRTAGYLRAVDDVSFSIDQGETFGLVGESGCGKTTVGKTVLRLLEATSGSVIMDGKDLCKLSEKEIRAERKNMQIIFQDPYSSLNPSMTVKDIIAEPLIEHKLIPRSECSNRVREILETVGINSIEMKKYPHEFSGGQRQRIAIARALAVNPKIIICDEPVSALDVSIQAQILNLMKKLQEDLGVSYLFIAHGMPVVQHISHRVGVMYLGKLVEVADSSAIFAEGQHPYTRALMSAIPTTDPENKKKRIILEGEIQSLYDAPDGCSFSSRCRGCSPICKEAVPELVEINTGHYIACHKFSRTG